MNKKILINKNKQNEITIAIVENRNLINFEIESNKNEKKKGNIYKGIVSKIEQSLDALFINYGAEKDGLLPFKEMSKEYIKKFNIQNGINSIKNNTLILNSEIIVQVEKEEKESKGVTLTTYISLVGCHLILMPHNYDLGGISKKIYGSNRYNIKELIKKLNIPKDIGIIIRTLGIGKNTTELKWEFNILISQFKLIKNLANKTVAPKLIYEENNLIIKCIRDYLKPDINEIIIDNINLFNLTYKYLSIIKSSFLENIFLFKEKKHIFNEYKIEQQIEIMLKREVMLPSGGYIIIDFAEALISIDINSSKSNKCYNIEETALQTNLEAVDEIAKQLRIRDINGLVIIDFIDMVDEISKFLVEKKLKEILSLDKAKIQTGKISNFGIMEVSRQKLKSEKLNKEMIFCKNCNGSGKIFNIEYTVFLILKGIKNEMNEDTYQICVETSNKVAGYMLNIRKKEIKEIEELYKMQIIILANKFISDESYKIYKLKENNKKIKLIRKNVWQ